MFNRCALALCVALAVLGGVGTASATIYHLTDLTPFGTDTASYGMGVTKVGSSVTVVGRSYTGVVGVNNPLVWSGGSGTPTNILSTISGATSGIAWAIDSNGDIAGRAIIGSGTRAFYLPNGAGTATILPVLGTGGMNFTAANGINNAGQVIGTSSCDTDGGNYHAFVWTAGGGMVDLDGLPGGAPYNGTLSSASGINASGQIVGMAYKADTTYDPVMWSYNGSSWTITNLNPLHNVCKGQSSAYAVNQYGDAVGSGFVAGGIMPTTNAILFKHDGTLVVLPGLGAAAPSDVARAINNAGLIVGNATTSSGAHAFIYDSTTGIEQDLNSLIAPDGSGTGWTLQWAYGIDDAGHVVGYGPSPGGTTHAYLLTPLLPGDANEDGTVNITDLSKVLTNYDKTGMKWFDGDFNGDGSVNITDLSNVLTNYDKSIGAGASSGITAVPEPSVPMLALTALLGLLTWAWRHR
jgi:probable HAF family extracellular repeat protein